ncbi:hypothetical protein V8E51_009993 [Hyaloscypha variabilis]
MPSFDRVREAIEGLTNDDIERLGSFKYIRYAWEQDSKFSEPGSKPVLPQSSYHELRLFTTHNGRLSFSICDTKEEDEIRRFPGSDVALGTDKQEYPWIHARVFIINSDRSRNGYVPIQDLSYRYAIPDKEDTVAKCKRVRDADLGEGKTVDAARSSSVVPSAFTIDQLQFCTW